MARAEANGIEIEYEMRGPAGGEPILMIGGLGMQLISWPDALIDGLAGAGFRPILFDNRDCGLSTRFEEAGLANIGRAFKQARAGEPVDAPYTIEDMADDGAGLLGALGIEAAHIYGSSNGGAVAQLVAIRHPAKTKSLASVMATSGRRGLPRPSQAASEWLNAPRPADIDRETFMELAWEQNRIMGSPGFPRDENAVRARAGALYDRAYYPPGHGRHLLASIASGDSRCAALDRIAAPTVVIHGAEDPLVPVGQGEDVKNSIPGARMVVIEGMGHDVPDGAAAQVVQAVAENARRAG
ncbi:MAG: alpha/beta fold hydrolase [Alphaproteobacteria bacterium]|nr:alpha/beta fold hydrolase [Alphaproteobacteria bacterium]